jgi:CO/xanthine dehydrogenase Mo-binding subunit
MKAVVEVDCDLGLARVVWLGTVQDVGTALNPQAVNGQIEGGASQGLGLALMEEIQVSDGVIQNASFTDYLIPTVLDMPPVDAELIELPDPEAPYGVKGAGELPSVVSTAAIVAALRDATGRELPRAPVRPEEIALGGLGVDAVVGQSERLGRTHPSDEARQGKQRQDIRQGEPDL